MVTGGIQQFDDFLGFIFLFSMIKFPRQIFE